MKMPKFEGLRGHIRELRDGGVVDPQVRRSIIRQDYTISNITATGFGLMFGPAMFILAPFTRFLETGEPSFAYMTGAMAGTIAAGAAIHYIGEKMEAQNIDLVRETTGVDFRAAEREANPPLLYRWNQPANTAA